MKGFITGDSLANDVRMRRSLFKGAFLLVEGESDEKLYGIYTRSDSCQILICHGRGKLLDACLILRDNNITGILGIADADFDHLEHRVPTMGCVIYTDWHDAECMMLRGAAFDRLLAEYSSAEKYREWCRRNTSDVRQYLLTQSALVGCLLWHSIANELSLDFDNLEVKEFVDKSTLLTDVESLVQHVKNKSSRHQLKSEDLIISLQRRRKTDEDMWQVVRGHDFVQFLGYAFRFAWGNANANSVSIERLEQSLRLAFPAEEFFATELCSKIRNWETNNAHYFILKMNGNPPALLEAPRSLPVPGLNASK